ncbi:MAG: plastocyanin/azurin family copper-binding protein [Solirubrobacteraceae bacterium]
MAAISATPTITVSSASTAGVEALNESLGRFYNEERHFWEPTPVEVTTSGAAVTFTNASSEVPHGVIWENAPATPACEEGAGKVPVGVAHSGYSWKGTCTFSKEGVYNYYCSVHGRAMSGTIYVNANGSVPPTPTTGEASTITETGATLTGTVNPSSQATSYFFQYGTSTTYSAATTEQSAGTADALNHSVSAPVGALTPGILYHYRLVARFASGQSSVQGADRTFTTLTPPGPPTATTGAASAIGETGATLSGTVNPGGQASTYSFVYGLTSEYGLSTPELPAGADRSAHAVSAPLTGLAPGTVYHYELIADNVSGPASGVDRTFTTTSPPSPPSTETPPSQTPVSGPSGITNTPVVTPTLIAFAPISLPAPVPIGGSPLVGGSRALTLAASQHGSSVHGSIEVSAAGAGGRLEVALFAPGASLAAAHRPSGVRVGRLLRSAVHAGVVSFATPLSVRARTALRRHHRLALTVQIVLTPLTGASASVIRSMVLRG